MTNSVSVEQCDREAAADHLAKQPLSNTLLRLRIREGDEDSHPLVQGFARHRLSALRQSSEREEKLRAMIVQMGENAAEAAKEYAASMEKLREALKDIAGNNWQDQSRARHVARQALEATNG